MGAGAPLSRKGAGVAADPFEIGRNPPDQLVRFSPAAPSAGTASALGWGADARSAALRERMDILPTPS